MAEGGGKTIKSDKELGQAYNVFIDDNGIINVVSLKVIREAESNTRLAELIQRDVWEILNQDPQKRYDMIVNLLPVGKGGYASSKAQRLYARIASHIQINRFAIVGGSIFVRTMAGFIIRAAGGDKTMKWFASGEEAIKWLKG